MTEREMMVIGVVYATLANQLCLRTELPPGATVADAIEVSGNLKEFTDIDLETQKVGIFGKPVKLDHALKRGDRVEIYRPITADPNTVKRRKVKKKMTA